MEARRLAKEQKKAQKTRKRKTGGKRQFIVYEKSVVAEIQNLEELQLAGGGGGGGVGSNEGEGVLGPTHLLPVQFSYLPWRRAALPLWP